MGYIGAQPATNFETVRKQVSTTNSGTTITLDYSVSSVQDILVTVNAVVQSYDNYSVSGTTLTLGGTLNNDRVEILYVGRTFQTVTPAIGTVTNDMLVNSSITLNGSAVSLGSSATVGGDNTPAFWVVKNANQSIAGDTTVKLTFETETLDSASNFASSRFTPQTSGYYWIYAQARFNSNSDADQWKIEIHKNGAMVNTGSTVTRTQQTAQVGSLVQFNGSSDYIEFFVYHNLSGETKIVENQSQYTYAQGYKLIGV